MAEVIICFAIGFVIGYLGYTKISALIAKVKAKL
jgi:hypothetical protein